ncbi:hypothetical protein BC940DRAFT_293718 [Gongronella butleri]|nr:hypothetical protein BC940DRAFT_293718 [Gongronella butleri]
MAGHYDLVVCSFLFVGVSFSFTFKFFLTQPKKKKNEQRHESTSHVRDQACGFAVFGSAIVKQWSGGNVWLPRRWWIWPASQHHWPTWPAGLSFWRQWWTEHASHWQCWPIDDPNWLSLSSRCWCCWSYWHASRRCGREPELCGLLWATARRHAGCQCSNNHGQPCGSATDISTAVRAWRASPHVPAKCRVPARSNVLSTTAGHHGRTRSHPPNTARRQCHDGARRNLLQSAKSQNWHDSQDDQHLLLLHSHCIDHWPCLGPDDAFVQ